MKDLEYILKVKGFNPIVDGSKITITSKSGTKYTYTYSDKKVEINNTIYKNCNEYYIFKDSKEQKLKLWNDRFDEYEVKGRANLIMALPNIKWSFTTGKYDCYDASMIGKNGLNIVEIKNRNVTSTTYDTAQFEVGKLHKMIEKKEQLGAYQMIFVAHYTDDITICWNLNKYVNNPVVKYLSPYETMGDNSLVTKEMILLPIEEGVKINRK